MQIKYLVFAFLVAASCGLFYSCSCEEEFPLDPEKIEAPLQVTDFSQSNGGAIIFFNKPVDVSTVIPNKTLSIEEASFTGFHYWEKNNTVLFIPPCEIYNPDFLNDSTRGYPFAVLLDGNFSDGAAVRGVDGSVLDGDRDFTGGGNFRVSTKTTNCPGIYNLVVTNYPNNTFTAFNNKNINQDSNYFFDIRFSNHLDPATAVYGDGIFLENRQTQQRIPGTLAVRNRNELRFTSTDKAAKLRLPVGSNFTYRFIVRGGNNAVLKSVYGASLTSDFTLNVRLE
jgi:hypothetical protein